MAKDKKSDNFLVGLFAKIIKELQSLNLSDNTKQRIISGLVMIPVAVYAIFYSRSVFLFVAISAAVLMAFEWIDITKSAKNQKKWRILGFFYILIPIFSVIKIRFYDVDVLFWMFAIIWSTDIFAFFAGKILGGAKLMPSVSPNKTWSGLAGGVLASILIGITSSLMFKGGILFFALWSAILSLVEQASDLFESKIKRIFGVKDSGNIIPGHGGVLDRLDGMIFVAPVVLILITFFADKF
jgi:phosphatidate cytidylyltransferase